MHFIDKRSKLIGTIGPASETYDVLKELIVNGMTTIRANFSHGDREEQLEKFVLARKIEKELNIPISILLDTKGPEIRVGKMKDGAQLIKSNTEIKWEQLQKLQYLMKWIVMLKKAIKFYLMMVN